MSSNTTSTKSTLTLVSDTPAIEESLERDIREAAARFGRGRKALIPVLRDIKSRRGSIPSAALDEIAGTLGLDYAKVHSVASFYTLLERIPGRLALAS